MLPYSTLIVFKDEFSTRVLSFPADGLEVLNVLRRHIGEEAKVLTNELSG